MRSGKQTVGIVGLGTMGGAFAKNLVAAGFRVIGFDVDPARRADAVARGAIDVVDDLALLARAPTLVLSLPTPEISASVVRNLLPDLRRGTLIVETSTVNPADMWRLSDLCAGAGIRVVDGAILSGVAQMAAGRSTLLVGGKPEDLDAAADVFAALAPRVIRFGSVGSGMAAKVINNAVAHAVMVILVEAGSMAAATGVNQDDLATLLADPDAGLLRPLSHRFVQRVLRADYQGGMPTEAARKDSTLALALAQTSGVPLFAIQGAHTVYELAVAGGLGRLDYASIAQLWERWTNRSFVAPGGKGTE